MTPLEIWPLMGDVGISFIEFADSLTGWDTKPLIRNGAVVALIKFKGDEFHFHSLGGHSFTRKDMREDFFGDLWEKYGYARTRTPKTDTRQQRFNERAGFHKIGEDEHEIHYQIDKPKD